MRWLIALCWVSGSLLTTTVAKASVESCAQSLLQSPSDVLYLDLRLSAGQAQQLQWIRDDLNRRSAGLQSQLDTVLAQLDAQATGGVYGAYDVVALLENRQTALLQQLTNLEVEAEVRAANLLTPWQRARCGEVQPAALVVAAPPRVMLPAWRTTYRPAVIRTPLYRRSRPIYRAPAPRYRAPAPRYRAPAPRPTVKVRVVRNAAAARRAPVARYAPAPKAHGRAPYRGSHQRHY